ncbi:MAG: hypothetical protein QMC13_01640, partial [Colwellia sp.]
FSYISLPIKDELIDAVVDAPFQILAIRHHDVVAKTYLTQSRGPGGLNLTLQPFQANFAPAGGAVARGMMETLMHWALI